MRSVYTNAPMNLPQRRREPALKTLLIMISVIALMFGIKLFYDPHGDLEDLAVMLETSELENSEVSEKNEE